MAELTDIQLRKYLEAYGETVGPINSSTRYLWEKRLSKIQSSRIPRKVSKSPSSDRIPSDSNFTPEFYRSRNRSFNRNIPVNRIQVANLNSSEESFSSFDFDSPLTGELGNSPYPLRANPKTTYLKRRTNERMFKTKAPTFELQGKGNQIRCNSPVDTKKKSFLGKTTKDKEEEFEECDEEYFLAENAVRLRRQVIKCLYLLVKVTFYVVFAFVALLLICFFTDPLFLNDERLEKME